MERSIIITVSISVALLLFILYLVRRRRLREEYSLLWIALGIGMILLSLSRDLLTTVSAWVGIFDPSNLVFLAAILFVLMILLYFSVVITRLTEESKESAQQIALLRYEIERLQADKTDGEEE